MFKKLMNWIFNMQERQNKEAYKSYLDIEHRKPPRRGQ